MGRQTLLHLLQFGHLFSFALSFGLVVFCDVMMISVPLTGSLEAAKVRLIEQASKLIYAGLVALIATGFGFFVYYWFFDAAALGNPKIYAKMTVVSVLAVNGVWLHHRGLGILESAAQRPLHAVQELPQLRKLLRSGAISAISWWSAFIMGTFRELNFAFSYLLLIGGYVMVSLCAIGLIELFITRLRRHAQRTDVTLYSDSRSSGASQSPPAFSSHFF